MSQTSDAIARALVYKNQGAIRSQPLIPLLEQRLQGAVQDVYGPGFTAQVYSGGQGETSKRTGSVRHDHGKAADVYIVDPNGKRVTGDGLAPLGQYWAAKRYGGVGMEMKGGGVHLDAWEKPPQGGGMHWNYANQGGNYTDAMRAAMEAGMRGELPSGIQNIVAAAQGQNAQNAQQPLEQFAAVPSRGPDAPNLQNAAANLAPQMLEPTKRPEIPNFAAMIAQAATPTVDPLLRTRKKPQIIAPQDDPFALFG